jgi:Phytanoyl-CoA dioxygenase (PhyH)
MVVLGSIETTRVRETLAILQPAPTRGVGAAGLQDPVSRDRFDSKSQAIWRMSAYIVEVAMILKQIKSVINGRRNRRRYRDFYELGEIVDLEGIGEFRNEAFPQGEPTCWLDRPDAEATIEGRLRHGEINAHQADAYRFWIKNGFLIIPGLIDHETLDRTWSSYEKALASGDLGDVNYVNETRTLIDRKLDPHLKVPAIRELQWHAAFLAWTDLLFGRKTIPFQTIMGHAGSQQAAHSDSIHMTTYPLGYLIANWTAFEDITADSGPLEYYPGSHRLPYLLSADVGIAPREFKKVGYGLYSERYEPVIRRLCEDAGLKKQTFLAKKGDVLFWHANLVHGGSLRTNPNASRKALVCHYFAEGVVTYHDLSGNPSRLHSAGMYAPVTA